MPDTGAPAAKKPQEIAESAVSSPSVPKLYGNGFTVLVTNADMALVLQLSGQPTAVVNMSYTLAKTLQQKLGRIVGDFEAKLGREIPTTDEIDGIFQEKK